jgi:hypothetical protein
MTDPAKKEADQWKERCAKLCEILTDAFQRNYIGSHRTPTTWLRNAQVTVSETESLLGTKHTRVAWTQPQRDRVDQDFGRQPL